MKSKVHQSNPFVLYEEQNGNDDYHNGMTTKVVAEQSAP